MVKKIFIVIILAAFAVMLLPFAKDLTPFQELSPTAKKYVEDGPDELGGANLVTSVIVTYRGLDTLGEVAVLFIAAAGVGFFLRRDGKKVERKKRGSSQILQSGASFLFPLILVFGVYIFVHGHLTPGGGFQGGVVLASGMVLLLLSRVSTKINTTVLHLVESLSGAAYVAIGILGLVLAAGFLDNRFLDLGEFGLLLSAGAIPLIYSFLGLKVGAELVGIIDNMQKGSTMTLITYFGFALILIGLWGMLTQKNIIKIIIGFSIVDTGVHMVMVSIGYLKDRTAPILDQTVEKADVVSKVVDPIPSALVLTAIVIGLAVTALMLSYAVKLYEKKGTLDINEYKELKW